MPTGLTQADPAVLRLVLRRLTELESEANGVADVVLGYRPNAGPGIADVTVSEVAAGLTDAFSTLADCAALTRRGITGSHRPYVEVDLRVVRDLDGAVR